MPRATWDLIAFQLKVEVPVQPHGLSDLSLEAYITV